MANFLNSLGLGGLGMSISKEAMSGVITYTLIIVLIIAIFGGIIAWFNYKKVYRYPVRIYRTRENGNVKEVNAKGGYINRGIKGAEFFRIKPSFFVSIDLTETPKLMYIDEDDRVYYKQIDLNTFIQMKRTISEGEVKLEPVESDVRYGAILSVQRVKDLLKLEPTWKKLLPYISLVVLAIVFLVAYYFLLDKKCGI
jgi:preprotein translocase subunit SecE